MQDFIDRLRSSKNIFLKAEGDAIERWKSLPHNKEGLQLFLNWNIAEVDYDGKSYFCTSNVEIVNRILKVLNLKIEVDAGTFRSMRNIVMAWDLVSDKIMSFTMKRNWQIMNFVSIDASNIEILNSMINNILKENNSRES